MPPKGDRLSAKQVKLLGKWIDQGADFGKLSAADQHWAYIKPVRPKLPKLKKGFLRFRTFRKNIYKALKVEFAGTGLKGAEQRRRAMQVISAYPDKGFRKEVGLGNIEYVIDVKQEDLYDANKDPLRLKEKAGKDADWFTKYERLIKAAGFVHAGARPLFVNPTGRTPGKRWLSNSLRLEWNRAAARAGLEVKMYEGSKHSTATALRRAGVPLDVIQAAAGHKDIRSTERYAQLADEVVTDALRRRR